MQPQFLLAIFIAIPVYVDLSRADSFLDDEDFDSDLDDFNSEDLLHTIRGAMGTLFEYVGDENGCFYKCSNEAKPERKPDHKPKTNGCGAFGIKLDTTHVPAIEQCCNRHDQCYDTCNRAKVSCDDEFRDCLTAICKDISRYVSQEVYQGCKSTADMMYMATMALGCKPYKDSQRYACLCPGAASHHTEL